MTTVSERGTMVSLSSSLRRVSGIGKPVSAIGAGCWTIGGTATNGGNPIGWDGVDQAEARRGLRRAVGLGVRLYDTADVYGLGRSERLVGELLKEIDRDDVVITSKVGYFAGTGRHPYQAHQIRHQLDTTLDNLGTDHLDVYFLHSNDFGPDDRHLDEAIDQMHAFQRQGLIRAVGMRAPHDFAVEWAIGPDTRWSRDAARFLHLFAAVRPDVLTVRHNLLSHQYKPGETDVFSLAHAEGVGVLIKQALGQGVLLGTHGPATRRTFSRADHRSTDRLFAPAILDQVHAALSSVPGGMPARDELLRLALGYALHRDPDAAVLVGFRDAEQIEAAVAALADPPTRTETETMRHVLAPVRDMLRANANQVVAGTPAATVHHANT